MRDANALHAAYQVLESSALGFASAWSPMELRGGRVLSAGVTLGGPVIELLSSPSLPARWDDRGDRAPARALLASVNFASKANSPAAPGLSVSALEARVAVDGARARVLSMMSSLGLSARSGVDVGGPALVVDGDGEGSAAASRTDAAPTDFGMKEVVVGAEGLFLSRALELTASMEASHTAVRDAVAMSAWRMLHCGTTLRVLPSRFSAIVFGARRGELENLKARLDGCASGVLRGTIYGDRHGQDGSGQVVVNSDALTGLDLRFCADAGVRPFFNEAREELTDFLDPRLNPDPGSAAAKTSMACNSIMGMDLVSTIKLRLLGRVS
jgi:hypothetical protein